LIALNDNNKVYLWKEGSSEPSIRNIPTKGTRNYDFAAVSLDGKKIIRTYKDKYIRLHKGLYLEIIDLANLKNESTLKNLFGEEVKNVTDIKYSPGSKKAIVSSDSLWYWVIDVDSQTVVKKLRNSTNSSINFTADGKYIVYESRDSIIMCDLKGNHIWNSINKDYQGNRSYPSQLFISSDNKSLVVQNQQYGNWFYESKNNNGRLVPLFDSSKDKKPNKTQFAADGTFGFANDNLIFAYSGQRNTNSINDLSLLLLRKYALFSNFSDAYRNINPYLSIKDSVDLGLAAGDKALYEKALSYYKQSFASLSSKSKIDYLLRGKEILNGLQTQNKENEDYYYSLKRINRSIFDIDSNYSTYTNEIKKQIETGELLFQKYSEDTASDNYKYYKRNLASDYGNLSFYLAFVEPTDSTSMIKAANKALDLNAGNDFVHTNIALAYLLRKDFENAKAIYKTYKGQDCKTCSTRPFTGAFLNDLERLERRNIISENKNKEIFEFTQKLKCWLQDKCSIE
jgi:hypothetical protein